MLMHTKENVNTSVEINKKSKKKQSLTPEDDPKRSIHVMRLV
jgi:hypothetical protein